MSRPILLACLLSIATLAFPRDKAETWIAVTSPHFVVATNGSEKQGRRVADQFERMRSVFHAAFPKLNMDSDAPITVLAIKDEKDFRALEPEAYLAKGSLKLGGLFLRVPDKNYVLMRLDAEGEHPYSVVYHEYTHLLLSKTDEFLPLWLNEGLAEFYQNTEIQEKNALLGEPSAENIYLLRQNKLLPLATLFTVDHNSPYYHEENKGSIFYAESWALTHYLVIKDGQEKTTRLKDYLEQMAQKVDPVTAATHAFGDLKQLQTALERYVEQPRFMAVKVATTTEVDDSVFKAQVLSGSQSDALRADFLAYNDRTADAQALLDHVLQEDPKNVSAHETKGLLEFRQGHIDEAKKWYAQAVQLDSQSYLAHYYFAAMSMSSTGDAAEQDRVEQSLRTAIKLNPQFAPAFDRLAVFLAIHNKDQNEAHMMGLSAISLDPSNIGYRLNAAHVLLTMNKAASAVQVLEYAKKLAKTPQETAEVEQALSQAQQYVEMRKKIDEQNARATAAADREPAGHNVPRLARREFVGKGPHRFIEGVLKQVQCDNPTLTLTVASKGKQLPLRNDNYFTISFTTLGFKPSGDLNPCSDLENRPAKVEYEEPANPADTAQLISVELHK